MDDISGLSPAISIEQKGTSHNPRSTVGTVTEIYDHLRLLFGRIGIPYCPSCGMPVMKYSLDEILDELYRAFKGEKIEIMSPQVRGKKGEFRNLFARNREQGFMRIRVDGSVMWLEEEIPLDKNKKHNIEVIVDRLKVLPERKNRIAEAVETALSLSEGYVMICGESIEKILTENYVCPECGISLPEVEPRLFSFNNPYGACPDCSGLGSHQYFSEESATDPLRSVFEGALLPWKKKHYMINKLERFAEYNN